jgi:hypothetical protein
LTNSRTAVVVTGVNVNRRQTRLCSRRRAGNRHPAGSIPVLDFERAQPPQRERHRRRWIGRALNASCMRRR